MNMLHSPVRYFSVVPAVLGLAWILPAQTQNWMHVRLVPSENQPSMRTSYSWACDEARGHLVLFGGQLDYVRLGDMWVHDGNDWSLRFPAHFPSPRMDATMAWDGARNRVLLFGGAGPFQRHADTWEWDGADWLQRTPTVAPPARNDACMTYDPVRQRVLLFGGMTDAGPANDTWEWDGSTWSQRNPANQPPLALTWQRLVWDTVRQRGVLVRFPDPNRTCSTWEWDGTNWTERVVSVVPPPRYRSGLAFDQQLGRVVLQDGMEFLNGTNPLRDLWTWDGTNWAQLTMPLVPTGVTGHELAWHPAWRSTVRFGGFHYPPGGGMSFPVYSTELWLFSGLAHPPEAVRLGVSCSSSAGTPVLEPLHMAWLGGSSRLRLTGVPASRPWFLALGFSDTNYLNLSLPAQLDAIGMPGCWIYNDVVESVPLSTATGTCHWSMTVPSSAALAGVRLLQQGFVHDPYRNPKGFVSTNAVSLVLGSTL